MYFERVTEALYYIRRVVALSRAQSCKWLIDENEVGGPVLTCGLCLVALGVRSVALGVLKELFGDLRVPF